MDKKTTDLCSGVIPRDNYLRFVGSCLFRQMEDYSDTFLEKNAFFLNKYKKKWIFDPFHQWSRQWEYPYVFLKIKNYSTRSKSKLNILDAGSGITFFPYYINSKINKSRLYCYDSDRDLREAYKKVNKTVGKDLVFRVGDIKRVPYDDNFFDIVYCISVLEHVGSYKETINEIHRIIKPGGIFIVTFDMSLDGISDISIHKARELQKLLVKRFSSHDKEFIGIGDIDKRNKILTTEFIESYDKSLLPWKRPVLILLYSLFKKRNLARILHLTVYCGSYKK